MNILLHFLLLCQPCHSLRNVGLSFDGRILGLIKSAYHGWLSMMTSSEGPITVLPRAPQTLNPPLCRGVQHVDRSIAPDSALNWQDT